MTTSKTDALEPPSEYTSFSPFSFVDPFMYTSVVAMYLQETDKTVWNTNCPTSRHFKITELAYIPTTNRKSMLVF